MADLQCLPEKSTRLSATYEVGGVQISAVNPTQAADAFFRSTSQGAGGFVTLTSAHGIVESQTDGRLRDILNAARMTLADGTPIAWIGTLRNPLVQRVSGARFFDELMHDPRSRHIRHYFYGGQPNCTSRVVARATELLGIDAIAGSHCPPFRPAGALEEDSVITQIVTARPDVIWVGLSTPKQEYWMANHTAHFPKTMLVGVGAAFDCFAGVQPRAPMIVQKMGLEWLYRLIQEPKRLWPRYRRVVPGMLKIFIGEVIRR
jgi:N-acetylglucosaminyldiphosphoundecaprenol N-acetyl-beta-D-mannosaminyltransferase